MENETDSEQPGIHQTTQNDTKSDNNECHETKCEYTIACDIDQNKKEMQNDIGAGLTDSANEEKVDCSNLSVSTNESPADELENNTFTNEEKEIEKIDIDNHNEAFLGALEKGEFNDVQLSLERGVDISGLESEGKRPLHFILASNIPEEEIYKLVQLLLEHNATVNISDEDGYSPLHIAIQKAQQNIIDLLLKNKADVNLCTGNKYCPVAGVARDGKNEILKLLFSEENPIPIHTCNVDGVERSLLYHASEKGHLETAEFLLDKGVSVDLKTTDRNSPIYAAVSSGNRELVKLLLDKGTIIDNSLIDLAKEHGFSEIEQLLNRYCQTEKQRNTKTGEDVKKKTIILFIGPRGSGKSATINTILQEEQAHSETNLKSESVTQEVSCYDSEFGDFSLIDTPSLQPGFYKAIEKSHKNVDIVAFVIAIDRIRSEEKRAIEIFRKECKTFFRKTCIILTRGKNLTDGKIADFINPQTNTELHQLYSELNERCVVFENKGEPESKSQQVQELKEEIQKMGKEMPDKEKQKERGCCVS